MAFRYFCLSDRLHGHNGSFSYVFDGFDLKDVHLWFFSTRFNNFSLLRNVDSAFKEMAKKKLLYEIFYCEKSEKSEAPDVNSISVKNRAAFYFENFIDIM